MIIINKKTGEILDTRFCSFSLVLFGTKLQITAYDRHNHPIWIYNSLSDFFDNWEDFVEKGDKV